MQLGWFCAGPGNAALCREAAGALRRQSCFAWDGALLRRGKAFGSRAQLALPGSSVGRSGLPGSALSAFGSRNRLL